MVVLSRRTRAPAVGLLVVAATMVAGCVSGFRVEASVAAPSAQGRVPVAGATVAMDCPQVIKRGSPPSPLGTTDASGVLVMDEPTFGRWIHDGCDLVVTKPGYETRRFPVEEICGAYEANHCTYAKLVAELAPQQ